MKRSVCGRTRLLAISALVVYAAFLPATAYLQGTDAPSHEEASAQSAEARVLGYLMALNSGDREGMERYIKDNYDPGFLGFLPLGIHVSIQMGSYYQTAGLGYDFVNLQESAADEVRGVVRNKLTGARLVLRIPLTDSVPHKIRRFPELTAASPPPGAPSPTRLSDEDIVARLELCMAKLVEDDEFSGTVLLAKDGKPLFEQTYGLASKSYQVPNRLDTKSNIASMGKMFTGVAVAQLVEQGKLSLDDPVSKYVAEDWLKPEISGKIQVQHLLTHTSGLGDYFRALYERPSPMVFRELEDYKPVIADATLAFEPGTRWSYSNMGYLVLGLVIEAASGESYFDYLRHHIFEPAGMVNTDAYEKDRPMLNRATGYVKEHTDDGVRWMSNRYTRVMKGMPSGGCFSTVEDLLRFDTALRSHTLLSPESTEKVLSAKPDLNSPFYGYGFNVSEREAGRIAEHGGDGVGIMGSMRMYLDAGYTAIVLSNYNRPSADIVDSVMGQLLAASEFSEARTSAVLNAAESVGISVSPTPCSPLSDT